MSVNAYLVITQNDGTLLKSENQKVIPSGFVNPFPGRPSLSSGKNPLFPIESYSLGVSNAVTVTGKTGPTPGKPDFGDLAVMRLLDVATTTVFIDLVSGKSVKFADILITKEIGDTETIFTGFGLGTVFFSSQQWSGSNEVPSESVSFAYQKLWTAYRAQNAQGTLGPWTVKGWDRAASKPL